MIFFKIKIFIFLFSAFYPFHQKIFSKTLPLKKTFLPIGGSKTLKVAPLHSVHVSNGKVIQVKDLEDKILIYGKKSGESFITSGKYQYKIYVLKKRTFQILNQIQNLLKTFKGLHFKIVHNKIIVDGELFRLSDWVYLSKVFTSTHENQKEPYYFFKAKMSPEIKKRVHQFFENKMKNLGRIWSTSQLNLNDHFIELSKEEKKDQFFWIKNFYPFGLPLIFSKYKVQLSPMVRVQIHIAEINKSWQRQFGFKWPEVLQTKIFPFQLSKESLSLELQSLENKGEGQLLASPSLVCQSGSEASFLAGGELPIKTSSQYNSRVLWKPHGILLNIKPVAESNGHMSIEISAEVSFLNHGQSINGIPSLKTNRISSHFNLKQKGTIVLSGLILHDFGKSSDQMPYLANIPLLGRLFKSKNFKDQKSELLIFVSPEVIQESPTFL